MPSGVVDVMQPEVAFGFLGMIVNKENLSRIFTGLKTIFNSTLKSTANTDWQKTAMVVPSTGEGEDYAWISRFPKLRKWVGDKVVKSLALGKYYKKNEDWETTIAVKRNHIEDDQLGIYNTQSQMAAESAAELETIIVDDLKLNAFAETGIDGQYFYDTDHVVNGASVSNKGTAALSAATQAAAAASYGVGRLAILSMKDDEGMPLRLVPDVLEVGPAQEAVAKLLVEAGKLADNSPNPYEGTATVLLNPAITDNQWMLHVTNKASVKPFIVQMRKAPVFVSQTSEENDDVFNRAEYKYGAEARATGLYGFWQLSYGSTGAA
jgi:phage major head subunit gpT-like protein